MCDRNGLDEARMVECSSGILLRVCNINVDALLLGVKSFGEGG